MRKKRNPDKDSFDGIRFVTEYIHYRTKKLMRASDYGYKAWPFGKRRRC